LTIHEPRSYELIGREVLPTVDAQGLKWSPDGQWIAVWDAASAGTKVLIFTADGQLFRAYTGPSGSDESLDLGVKVIEWSPVSPHGNQSEVLAVGKVDGTVDLLQSRTVSMRSPALKSHADWDSSLAPPHFHTCSRLSNMLLVYGESDTPRAAWLWNTPNLQALLLLPHCPNPRLPYEGCQ
jgi:WD40 repeat protein